MALDVAPRSSSTLRTTRTNASNDNTAMPALADNNGDTFAKQSPTPLALNIKQPALPTNGAAQNDASVAALYAPETTPSTTPSPAVTVPVDVAAAYKTANPSLDAWRQAAMKAGYGDVMGYVEASKDASKDFSWKKSADGTPYPLNAADYQKAFGSAPGKEPYTLQTKELDDGRAAMKLGYESLTQYQRYGLTDDKASRLTPDVQSALLTSRGDRVLSSSTPPLAGLADRKLASLGERLSNFTSVVRRQQGGEPGLQTWIDDEAKALRGMGDGSPMGKDVNAYVGRVLSGEKTADTQNGACVGLNATVGPYVVGVSQCTNNKIYLTTGVTTAVGVGVDEQNTVVVANNGKTVDDVVSGESQGVTASSAKIGGSGSVSGNSSGTSVSAGPSLGLGLPAGITNSTTTQIGTFTPPPIDTRKQDDIKMTPARRVLVSKLGVPQR